MSSKFPRWLVFALVLPIALVLMFLWNHNPSPDPQMLQVHHGVWTDENGVPGNRIYFWTVSPSQTGPITAVEGRFRVKDFLKRKAADGVWNFENWAPLRLNVVFQDDASVAAVNPVDPDHLLIRFSKVVDELSKDDWHLHPDTLRLRRVVGEPCPPP